MDINDGRALWELLHDEYAPSTDVHRQALLQAVMEEPLSADVPAFITALRVHRNKLIAAKADLRTIDPVLVARVLSQLPSDYNVIMVAAMAEPKKTTWASLSRAVLDLHCVAPPANAPRPLSWSVPQGSVR